MAPGQYVTAESCWTHVAEASEFNGAFQTGIAWQTVRFHEWASDSPHKVERLGKRGEEWGTFAEPLSIDSHDYHDFYFAVMESTNSLVHVSLPDKISVQVSPAERSCTWVLRSISRPCLGYLRHAFTEKCVRVCVCVPLFQRKSNDGDVQAALAWTEWGHLLNSA